MKGRKNSGALVCLGGNWKTFEKSSVAPSRFQDSPFRNPLLYLVHVGGCKLERSLGR